jgi:4'-phosphopantetheinyl transferase EntD
VLKVLGLPNETVTINGDSSPKWPASIVASLSHTSNKALCITGKSQFFKYIGADIEPWFANDLAQEIKNDILNS